MEFKDRFKKARERAGLTQLELSNEVKKFGGKLSQQMISMIEKGERTETSSILETANACGVSPYWLKSGEGEMIVVPTSTEGMIVAGMPEDANQFIRKNDDGGFYMDHQAYSEFKQGQPISKKATFARAIQNNELQKLEDYCLNFEKITQATPDSLLKAIDALLKIDLESDAKKEIQAQLQQLNKEKQQLLQENETLDARHKKIILMEESVKGKEALCHKKTRAIYDSAIAEALRQISDKDMPLKEKEALRNSINHYYKIYSHNGNLFNNESLSSKDKGDMFF